MRCCKNLYKRSCNAVWRNLIWRLQVPIVVCFAVLAIFGMSLSKKCCRPIRKFRVVLLKPILNLMVASFPFRSRHVSPVPWLRLPVSCRFRLGRRGWRIGFPFLCSIIWSLRWGAARMFTSWRLSSFTFSQLFSDIFSS